MANGDRRKGLRDAHDRERGCAAGFRRPTARLRGLFPSRGHGRQPRYYFFKLPPSPECLRPFLPLLFPAITLRMADAILTCGGNRNCHGEAVAPSQLYLQPENFILAIRVFQLKTPVIGRYSLANQNVQSSTGSTATLV